METVAQRKYSHKKNYNNDVYPVTTGVLAIIFINNLNQIVSI